MKTSITSEELITMLETFRHGKRIAEVMKIIDPEFTEEMFHYYQVRIGQRVKSYNDSHDHNANPFTITAEVLKEDKLVSIAYVIALLGVAHHNYGVNDYRHQKQNRKTEIINGLLDNFLKDLKTKKES